MFFVGYLFVLGGSQPVNLDQNLTGKLDLTLITEKTEYLKSEIVRLELELTNRTNRFLAIPGPSQTEYLKVEVLDQRGSRVPDFVIWDFRAGVKCDTMPPHALWIEMVSLVLYGNDTTQGWRSADLLPGAYTVRVSLDSVYSNSVEVEVKMPPPDEQEVRNAMLDLLRSRLLGAQKAEAIRQLMTKYPHTRYMSRLYVMLLGSLSYQKRSDWDPAEVMREALNFMSSAPNSIVMSEAIRFYTTALSDSLVGIKNSTTRAIQQETRDRLAEIGLGHPDTRLARYIQDYISRNSH